VSEARVRGEPVAVDRPGLGRGVGDPAENVDRAAGGAERQPRQRAAGHDHHDHGDRRDHRWVERHGLQQQPGRTEDRTEHRRGQHPRPSLAETDQAPEPGDQHGSARDGQPEERVVTGHRHQAGDRGVRRGQPGDRDGGLGLAPDAGERDRDDGQRDRDDGRGHRRGRRPALEEQRGGSQAHREADQAQRGAPPRGWVPRREVVLDDVGHGLDHVVVGARRLVVDPGGEGQQAAVLDPLGGQAGVGRELPPVRGHQPVAGVHHGRVEEPDAAGELGDELGDGDGGGEREVDPSRPRRDGHPDQGGRG
jgi:hypothetical protein